MFKPVQEKSDSIYGKVVTELKSAIMSGRLKPGDKLPGERVLAEMLGVSRTSLREALKMLAAAGLVTIKHGQGVFIANHDHDSYLQKFVQQVLVNPQEIKELFEIRKVLETQAAAWVAERGSTDQINRLAGLLTSTKDKLAQQPTPGLALLAEQDSKFHLLLAEATNNSVLVRIMEGLLDLLADSRCRSMAVPGRPLKSLEEHRQVVEALLLRQPDAAREAMLQHLENVEKDIL